MTTISITRLTPVDQLPDMLRVDEAAAWLDCGSSTVRAMVTSGALAHVRLGRLLRIPKTALVALVNGTAIDVAS